MSNQNKLPELPTNPTAADMNAFMNVMSKNVELLSAINNDLKILQSIKDECSMTKQILEYDLIEDIVDAAIVEKQLDLTNDTSKLFRIINENNLFAKKSDSIMGPMAENVSKIEKHLWKFAAVITIVITLTGAASIWRNIFMPENTKNKQNSMIQQEQYPIYNFTPSGQVYLLPSTGDTLWITTQKPNIFK